MMKIVFRIHAIQRMFERSVSVTDIRAVLESGETIEEYPDDTPFPSRLVLGWRHERPLHVVVANNLVDEEMIMVTVYEPGLDHWESDFKRRKQ